MTRLKLVEATGARRYARVHWGNNLQGHGSWSYHDASTMIEDLPKDQALDERGYHKLAIHSASDEEVHAHLGKWPTKCDLCGEAAPPRGTPGVGYDIFYDTLYDDPPRPLQVGDIFRAPWFDEPGLPPNYTVRIGPTRGDFWATNMRAANCSCYGKPRPPGHRCWQVVGDPPAITVTPSIGHPGIHIFIRNGEIVPA